MQRFSKSVPFWLASWMKAKAVQVWGVADLRGFKTPRDETGKRFPSALSWAIPMNPEIMAGIKGGPNQAYAEEYSRVNARINDLAIGLATEIKAQGFRARALAASERTDKIQIKGDFPHKTAASRAGLGWIGRHCQLITRKFGSWIRLGTVFTDMDLPCGPPLERHFCGSCMRCVDACPPGALKGGTWYPGVPRGELLDAKVCDRWKKENYLQYHNGHNCGICSSVCPYGLKYLKRQQTPLDRSEKIRYET